MTIAFIMVGPDIRPFLISGRIQDIRLISNVRCPVIRHYKSAGNPVSGIWYLFSVEFNLFLSFELEPNFFIQTSINWVSDFVRITLILSQYLLLAKKASNCKKKKNLKIKILMYKSLYYFLFLLIFPLWPE